MGGFILKRSIGEIYEFLAVIGILALIFFIFEYFNIAIDRIYVIIGFLVIWIGGKMILRNRSK